MLADGAAPSVYARPNSRERAGCRATLRIQALGRGQSSVLKISSRQQLNLSCLQHGLTKSLAELILPLHPPLAKMAQTGSADCSGAGVRDTRSRVAATTRYGSGI